LPVDAERWWHYNEDFVSLLVCVHCYCDALWSLTQPHLISDDGTALLECIRHTSTLEWEERLGEVYSDFAIVSTA
jgi:hypothetical protein